MRYDGNRRARRLNGPYRRRAHRDDNVHLFLDQLGRQARKPGGIAVGDTRHQLDLLSLAARATQSGEVEAEDSPYRSGRSPDWLKMKNPACEAVRREAEEEWGR